jgi:hypothetical protein
VNLPAPIQCDLRELALSADLVEDARALAPGMPREKPSLTIKYANSAAASAALV